MTGPESKEVETFTPWNQFYEALLGVFSKRLTKQEVHQNVFPTFAITPSGGRNSSLKYSFRRNQKETEEGTQNKYTLRVEVTQPSQKVANSINLADIGIARATSDKRYEVVLEEVIGENGSYLSRVALLVNNYDEKMEELLKPALS